MAGGGPELSPFIEKAAGASSGLGPFRVKFACSSHACVTLLQVIWFPPTDKNK